jgi:hypothetical protein
MSAGELLTRGTVLLAVLGYFIGAGLRFTGKASARAAAKWAWIFGAGLCGVHILLAFHFYHHWSQSAAIAETARQTQAMTGINWGGGVYLNYLFAAVWLTDAAWWLFADSSFEHRPRWLGVAVQAWLAFIVFNSTVVFGSAAARWFGIAGFATLGIAWLWRQHGAVKALGGGR